MIIWKRIYFEKRSKLFFGT